MNETQIETLLRKAPHPKAPEGLLERLKEDIELPPAASRRETVRPAGLVPFWKRWLPAVSFALFFVGCVVALAVQTQQIVELRRQNAALRASRADLESLRQENAEVQQLRAAVQGLEQLRKDNQELQRLQAEVAQMRGQIQELAQLRAENQRLRAERAAIQTSAAGAEEEDPFAEARKKAERIHCISNLKQIGLAARMWANDNGDGLPSNFLTMSNELNTPKILVCPADTSRTKARTWAEFNPGNVSYEIVSPGIKDNEPDVVFARCPVHENCVLVDGSAHQLGPNSRIIDVDGRKKLGR